MKPQGTPFLDAIATSFGGRRIFAVTWSIWLFCAFLGTVLLDPDEHPWFRSKHANLAVMLALAIGLFVACLIKAGFSNEYRAYLLGRVSPKPEVSRGIRFFIRAIPFIALMPLIARWYFSL